jgi:hypothetical protein
VQGTENNSGIALYPYLLQVLPRNRFCFVTGHDFSRAETVKELIWGFSPCDFRFPANSQRKTAVF